MTTKLKWKRVGPFEIARTPRTVKLRVAPEHWAAVHPDASKTITVTRATPTAWDQLAWGMMQLGVIPWGYIIFAYGGEDTRKLEGLAYSWSKARVVRKKRLDGPDRLV